MGQIVKGKKKGRPSKADLARRATMLVPMTGQSAEENDRRRSLRRRNVRYNNFIDYDDYLDEFEDFFEEEGGEPPGEEEEEEEARRKEKKLKLVLNLHEQNQGRVGNRTNRKRGRSNRVFHTRVSEPRGRIVSEEEEEDDEDEDEEDEEGERNGKLSRRKRGIYGSEDEALPDRNDDDEGEDGEEYGRNNGNEEDDEEDDLENRGRKRDQGREDDSIPGTPSDNMKQLPMPDKKSLELILDKLQKKDIYGVYAEPVDLEELPDYLDVIDHPMDFATVRKKLTNGAYTHMEQFESDVFLICSNAMKYNSSDTVYHKQARTIQELATKKFQKLKIKIERTEKDGKSEQKTRSNLLLRKQGKKALSRSLQEPVGSDFSSGATLATNAENQNGSVPFNANSYEKPSNVDTHVENSTMLDNLTEKVEELSSGKGNISRFGRKPNLFEDRRSTYNMPHHSSASSESVLATFDSEIKQLVAVGLHADHAYSRSLSRFAATLGPVAWKVASPRIEHALPSGYKYGRGWVGEYEPLPTPILMLEAQKQSESTQFPKVSCSSDIKDVDLSRQVPDLFQEQPSITHSNVKPSLLPNARLTSNGKLSPNSSCKTNPSTSVSSSNPFQKPPAKNLREGHNKKSLLPNVTRPAADINTPVKCFPGMKNSAFSSPSNLPHNLAGRSFLDTPKNSKLVELNLPPPPYNDDTPERQSISKFEIASTKQREVSSAQVLTSHSNSVVPRKPDGMVVPPGDIQNGKVVSLSGKLSCSSSDAVQNNAAPATTFFSHGHDHGLTDPVEAMRISTQKAQNHHSSSKMPLPDNSATQAVLSVRSDPCNAAATAARAWMSIGAGNHETSAEHSTAPKGQFSVESLYNPVRNQLRPQIARPQGQFAVPAPLQFPSESNGLPFQSFMPPAMRVADGMHLRSRPMLFSHLAPSDLARFQMQLPWRGLAHQTHQKPKPDTLPPDLNIGFQSPGSPVKQSSTVMSDSQQPDLALQL